MKKIEKFFDINMVLMTIYSALEEVREAEEIELVYDIEPTIPKELRGDVGSVTHVLTQLLNYVFLYTPNREVILSLKAPKDFLYEESIAFEIEESGISRQKALSFFQSRIKPATERLEATTSYTDDKEKIAISIPFKLNDLGNRRYYRLPDIGMLGKKVLLIAKSKIVAESLEKMFRYFLYEVDVGAQAYKSRGSNLAIYDIFVLEEGLMTPGIEELVEKVQHEHDLKFVILQGADRAKTLTKKSISAYLVKPVMQESIFELIISLFEGDIRERKIKKEAGKPIINMEKYIIDAFKKSEEAYVEMEKIQEEIGQKETSSIPSTPSIVKKHLSEPKAEELSAVLNVEKGKQKSATVGLDYSEALKSFKETFDRSDVYFREIAKGKAVWQIKEFAIDLEKKASMIGAERMAGLAEKISLMFVYDNLDMLPVYIGKYHLELKRVMKEIDIYLKRHHKA